MQPSYPSPYDRSNGLRLALAHIKATVPAMTNSQASVVAFAVSDALHDKQVLPLLMSLAALNKTLDILGVPLVERTDEHPDYIDQLHLRLEKLISEPISKLEDDILHRLLDEVIPPKNESDVREPLNLRIKQVTDELMRWRETIVSAVSETPEEIRAFRNALTEPIVMVAQEVAKTLVLNTVPMPNDDIAIEGRLDDLNERLEKVRAAQLAIVDNVGQLNGQIGGLSASQRTWANDLMKKLGITSRKLSILEASVTQMHQRADQSRKDAQDDRRINRELIVALQKSMDQLREAVLFADTSSERLIREALDSSGTQELIRLFGSGSISRGKQNSRKTIGGRTITLNRQGLIYEHPSPKLAREPKPPKLPKKPRHYWRTVIGSIFSFFEFLAIPYGWTAKERRAKPYRYILVPPAWIYVKTVRAIIAPFTVRFWQAVLRVLLMPIQGLAWTVKEISGFLIFMTSLGLLFILVMLSTEPVDHSSSNQTLAWAPKHIALFQAHVVETEATRVPSFRSEFIKKYRRYMGDQLNEDYSRWKDIPDANLGSGIRKFRTRFDAESAERDAKDKHFLPFIHDDLTDLHTRSEWLDLQRRLIHSEQTDKTMTPATRKATNDVINDITAWQTGMPIGIS